MAMAMTGAGTSAGASNGLTNALIMGNPFVFTFDSIYDHSFVFKKHGQIVRSSLRSFSVTVQSFLVHFISRLDKA